MKNLILTIVLLVISQNSCYAAHEEFYRDLRGEFNEFSYVSAWYQKALRDQRERPFARNDVPQREADLLKHRKIVLDHYKQYQGFRAEPQHRDLWDLLDKSKYYIDKGLLDKVKNAPFVEGMDLNNPSGFEYDMEALVKEMPAGHDGMRARQYLSAIQYFYKDALLLKQRLRNDHTPAVLRQTLTIALLQIELVRIYYCGALNLRVNALRNGVANNMRDEYDDIFLQSEDFQSALDAYIQFKGTKLYTNIANPPQPPRMYNQAPRHKEPVLLENATPPQIEAH